MIGSILGGIGAATGLGMGIAGMINSHNAQRESANQYRRQQLDNENIYKKQYYEDILNRKDTQHMLRGLRERLKEYNEQQNNVATVTGATSEASAVAKEANAKAYADAIANIAASDSQRKDAALANYQGQMNTQYNNWANLYNQYASNWTNFASQAFGAGAQAVQGIDWDAGGATKPSGGSGLLESQYNKPYY